jgi:peptide/nickel transport system substrate-binding protein
MKNGNAVYPVVFLILIAAAGCTGGQRGSSGSSGGAVSSSQGRDKYNQAPVLNTQELPPVEQRLPENPKVIKPFEKTGKYGGTLKVVTPNTFEYKERAVAYTVAYEGRSLLVWSMDQKEVIPNIAESFTISPDGRDYAFNLRKGMKWSNGAPFTTEDVRFWYEDVHVDPDLSPGIEPEMVLEVINETQFIFHYKEPSPLEIYTIAFYAGSGGFWFLPDEYLKKYHIKYNPQADSEARSAGYKDWKECFYQKYNFLSNWELPTLSPFMLVTQDSSSNVMIWERNPYFWAVDTEGNQLPYLDAVQVSLAGSVDAVKMRSVAGENDLGLAVIQESFIDYPFYMENAERGKYSVRTANWVEPNAMNIHINKTHQNPAKRAVMGTVEFRRAMSLALDRDKIISINYSIGPVKSTPRNFAPYPESPYADPKMANNYVRYDIAEANRLLDSLGLDKKNSSGKRMLPNGSVFTLIIDVPTFTPDWIDIGNQLAECWQNAGLDVTARSIDPALWTQRWQGNDYDVSIHTGSGGMLYASPMSIAEYTGYNNRYNWATIFQYGHIIYRNTEGQNGVPPDEDIKRLWDLGSAIVIEPDTAKRESMIKEVLAIHEKNLYILGIGTRMPYAYIVKEYLHNVPPLQNDWGMGHGGHGHPSQYYIE